MDISDRDIVSILTSTKTIAVVGASNKPDRPSFGVTGWLVARGYRVFPINPGLAGTIHGRAIFATLADVPEPLDMVDIFRNSAAAGPVVEEALALPSLPKVIWMQLGVVNDTAAALARSRGVTVIMDRCPVIEARRLSV